MQQLLSYCHLMRLNRPIGWLLLLWPTWIALWIAGGAMPSMHHLAVFTLGVIVMRSGGCVINDFADRKIDGKVTRTQHRPLAIGSVSTKEALLLFSGLMLLALILVCTLNLATCLLACGALVLATTYPFMKRVTHFPQLVLGLAFSWGILMAYAAQGKPLGVDCWLLFFANFVWIVAYDTAYAMADKSDDLKIGVKSTAIFFGQYDRLAILVCQCVMLGSLLCLGCVCHLKNPYFTSLVLVAGCMLYQQWLLKTRQPQACLKAFLNNHWVGCILFLGTVLSLPSLV